jgi:hypothetical protein
MSPKVPSLPTREGRFLRMGTRGRAFAVTHGLGGTCIASDRTLFCYGESPFSRVLSYKPCQQTLRPLSTNRPGRPRRCGADSCRRHRYLYGLYSRGTADSAGCASSTRLLAGRGPRDHLLKFGRTVLERHLQIRQVVVKRTIGRIFQCKSVGISA